RRARALREAAVDAGVRLRAAARLRLRRRAARDRLAARVAVFVAAALQRRRRAGPARVRRRGARAARAHPPARVGAPGARRAGGGLRDGDARQLLVLRSSAHALVLGGTHMRDALRTLAVLSLSSCGSASHAPPDMAPALQCAGSKSGVTRLYWGDLHV